MVNVFLTPAQCRMARALLDWTQPELAERCGLAVMTISKFEKEEGTAVPEVRTLQKITTVFEIAGVVFTDAGGVEPKSNFVTVLEGKDVNNAILDDVYETMKNKKGAEVLIAGLSEVDADQKEKYAFLQAHLKRLKAAGITERILINKGDRNIVAPAEWYRYVPQGQFDNAPFQIYDNKIVMKEWGEKERMLIIEHSNFANTLRNMFNIVWDQSEPVK